MVQERSRSVKAIFAIQRRGPPTINTDSGAFLYDSSTRDASGNSLQSFQFRIGGRYFPAAPVQLAQSIGSAIPNGGAEAWLELQKALNIVGDYRLQTSANTLRWAIPASETNVQPEYDYSDSIVRFNSVGQPMIHTMEAAGSSVTASACSGNAGSCVFAMATDLETSNGVEISGLNAEEQSDIALIANWARPQAAANVIEVYTYYDAMIILRENNVLELIQ